MKVNRQLGKQNDKIMFLKIAENCEKKMRVWIFSPLQYIAESVGRAVPSSQKKEYSFSFGAF